MLGSVREGSKNPQLAAFKFYLDLRARCYEEAEIIIPRTPIYQQPVIALNASHQRRIRSGLLYPTVLN